MKYLPLTIALLFIFPTDISAQKANSVQLVVQQNGQALVTELRALTLPKGQGSVLLPDLPSTIDPQTMQVRSKTAPRALTVLDLTLDEDLLTPATLLRRSLGRQVTLILPDGKTQGGRIQKEATVLSTDEAPVFLIDGAVYAGPYEAILYSELPKGLAPRPRLTLNVDNSGPVKQDIELTYIARELSWRMDYVLAMNKAGSSGQLTGWVTLQNRSGADFNEARVELLAGEPRSVTQAPSRALFASKAMSAPQAMDTANAPEELFEYHLYRLKRPVTLANQQSRQIQLFESSRLAVTRKLLGRASAMPSGREAEPIKENLDAVVTFRNTEASGLGLPLPKGTLRAFQDQDGSRHFLGEALVERTAKGNACELRLGQVFDIAVERVALELEKTGKNSYKVSWELRLRNSKDKSQQVVLQELLPGKWKVLNASQNWSKPSSGVLEFVVDVPANTGQEPHLVKYSFTTEL